MVCIISPQMYENPDAFSSMLRRRPSTKLNPISKIAESEYLEKVFDADGAWVCKGKNP